MDSCETDMDIDSKPVMPKRGFKTAFILTLMIMGCPLVIWQFFG